MIRHYVAFVLFVTGVMGAVFAGVIAGGLFAFGFTPDIGSVLLGAGVGSFMGLALSSIRVFMGYCEARAERAAQLALIRPWMQTV